MKKSEAGNNTGSRPPISAIEAIFEGVALAAFFMTIWFPIEAWPHLPQNTVSPGALGGKGNLLFLPILNTFLYLAFGLAVRLYKSSRVLIRGFKALILLLFAFLEWTAVRLALGSDGLSQSFFPILLLLLSLIVGISLFIGMRAR